MPLSYFKKPVKAKIHRFPEYCNNANTAITSKAHILDTREEKNLETQEDIDRMIKTFNFVLFLYAFCVCTLVFPFRGLLVCNNDRLNMALRMFH